MDRRTLIAVALCLIVFVFYQPLLRMAGLGKYLEPPRRTSAPATPDTAAPAPRADTGAVAPAAITSATPEAGVPAGATLSAAPERTIRVQTALYDALFSNRGARLLSVTLSRYATPYGETGHAGRRLKLKPGEIVPEADRVQLDSNPVFGMDLGSGDHLRSLANLVYAVEESTDASGAIRALTFTAHDSGGPVIRQIYRLRENDYAIDLEVRIEGVPPAWRLSDYSLVTRSWALFTETDLQADHRQLRTVSLIGKNVERKSGTDLARGNGKYAEGNARWAGVQSRYFVNLVALVSGSARGVHPGGGRRPLSDEERKVMGANAKPDQEYATNALVMAVPSEMSPVNRFLLYVGPIERKRLAGYAMDLDHVVDLGMNWLVPISRPLLGLLVWLYGLVRNYGVAIVLLATLVRLVLHPLNVTSIRSMRALQRIQPELERIRAKYKNDPQALNTAMMALYKENKVNPAGGCLPLVIQMPIFFALFSVLFNAIELRQAPFVGWLHDLSAPDQLMTIAGFPIRLLPVFMTLTGLLLQRLTPTDPQQAPTMYFMNLFMLVLLYNSPSGLVLYWTVLNLLTGLQQWLVMRGEQAVPATVRAVQGTPVKPSGRKGRS